MMVSTPAKKQVKKRVKRPLVVRGEPVVQSVIRATIEELARVGYGALRFEDVAARAGVNKTTIYRRWPQKVDLVQAALSSFAERALGRPATGSLRGDLMEIGRAIVAKSCSAQGESLVRVLMAERHPDMVAIDRALHTHFEAVPLAVVKAAIDRGEVAPDLDARVLMGTFVGALHHCIFMKQQTADETFIGKVVDLLLTGALIR
jgi:AcrR family transcriptional regulator